ncbi:hypothetical protein BH23BAC1_BH23BAC1_24520 [soil metagenome]
MEILTIKKSIEIDAPKEKVWEVLQEDQYTRNWYAEFKEGSHAVTDWKEGSKALFLDNEGNGMIGRIITKKPFEIISIEYDGFIMGGVEDYESEGARATKGTKETYRLSGTNGKTKLDIESDMGKDWFDSMSEAWDRALEKIKELSRQK